MRKPKVKSVVIIGKRWFRRSYGGTYHTATMVINGTPAGSTPQQYGYGDQYVHTAFEQLEQEGLIPKRHEHANGAHEAFWEWSERTGILLVYSASDVAREKDL